MGPLTTGQAPALSSGTEIYFDRFLKVWQGSTAVARARAPIVFFAGLALICGTTALIGAVPTKMYGHDVFVSLDAGWRTINGQRPHADFVSGWGPVWFLAEGLGLAISRRSVNGVGYANAIMALLVGSWSFLLGKDRLVSSTRILLGLFLAALVAAPYPLGNAFFITSHAMVYNRYGYALLGLILQECLAATFATAANRDEGWMGGISTGAALSLTLFLKASYFFVGIVLIAIISFVLKRLQFRRLAAIALGFLLLSTCMLAYVRFDALAMLRDLRMAGGARAGVLTPALVLSNALSHASVWLGVVFLVFAAALLSGKRVPRLHALKLLILGTFIFLADIGLLSTNAQFDGFPLCAVFAIMVLNEVTQDQQALTASEAYSGRPLYAGVLLLGALLFVPQFTSDLAGLAYGAWKKERPPNPEAVLHFTSPNLAPLLLYDGFAPRSNGRVFTSYVNDGVALLTRETRPDETIVTMDMTNPFSYALERRLPHRGILSPTYHLNLDDAHRPSDDEFFGDANIVMVPKHPALDDVYYSDFLKAYEAGLLQRYYLADSTNWWWMYRRK
jgi:hypothetical protein